MSKIKKVKTNCFQLISDCILLKMAENKKIYFAIKEFIKTNVKISKKLTP
jgi:hypothetical protein